MARNKKSPESSGYFNDRKFNQAESDEERENQMTQLALDLVEWRLRNGTASSQETTHFLKYATAKAKQDYEIGERQKQLLEAKTSQINEARSLEALYTDAIKAMREYNGDIYTGEED